MKEWMRTPQRGRKFVVSLPKKMNVAKEIEAAFVARIGLKPLRKRWKHENDALLMKYLLMMAKDTRQMQGDDELTVSLDEAVLDVGSRARLILKVNQTFNE